MDLVYDKMKHPKTINWNTPPHSTTLSKRQWYPENLTTGDLTCPPVKKVIPISIGFSNMGYCSSSRMECHQKLIRFLQSISFHFPE